MERSFSYIIGFAVPFLVIAAALYIFSRHAHTDGRRRPRYDERQELIRGRGYQYAFYTVICAMMVYALAKQVFGWDFADSMTETFAAVLLGIAVYAGYAVWHEAYFALNEKRKSYVWLFVVIGVINLGIGLRHIFAGDILAEGRIVFDGAANLLCGVLFLTVLAVLLVREIALRREEK